MAARRCQACGVAVDVLVDICPHMVSRSGELHGLEIAADHAQADPATSR